MGGKLIVIEGSGDGCGKSTQYDMLFERLKNENVQLCRHHFPSYSEKQGKLVEMYLSGEFGAPETTSPYLINSLYAIDRAVTWLKKLKNEYESGTTLLLDRYTTSSIIYQSALITDEDEKRKFIDYVIDYEYNKLGIKEPDKVIFLHVAFDFVEKMLKERINNPGVKNDIHERNVDFLRKVYESSIFAAQYLNWDIVEGVKNEKMRSREDIHEEVYTLVKKMK